MILIHSFAAIYGQSIWSDTTVTLLPGITLTLTQLLAVLSLSSLANAILSNAAIVLFGVQTPLDKAGLKIPRRQGNRIIPVIPVTVLSILAMISYKLGYFHLNCMMYVLLFGFTYAKLTMKLVVSDPKFLDPILGLILILLHFRSRTARNPPWNWPTHALWCQSFSF